MTTAKTNPGRKKLPEGKGKTIQVALRLTEDEWKELTLAAEQDKRTLANYVRWAALGVARGEF